MGKDTLLHVQVKRTVSMTFICSGALRTGWGSRELRECRALTRLSHRSPDSGHLPSWELQEKSSAGKVRHLLHPHIVNIVSKGQIPVWEVNE